MTLSARTTENYPFLISCMWSLHNLSCPKILWFAWGVCFLRGGPCTTGLFVVADWFGEERYKECRSCGMNSRQVQSWVSMVELMDVFKEFIWECRSYCEGSSRGVM